MKYNVRMFSMIKYSKERAKTKKETEEKLQRKMRIAQTEFEQTPVINSKISLRNVKRIWRISTRKKQMD